MENDSTADRLARCPVLFCATAPASIGCIASAIGGDPLWFRIALYANLVGLTAALLAAAPDVLDAVLGDRARSSDAARGRRVRRRMLCNLAAVVVFATNVYLHWGQRDPAQETAGLSLALCAAGFALTLSAGLIDTERARRSRTRSSARAGVGHGPSVV